MPVDDVPSLLDLVFYCVKQLSGLLEGSTSCPAVTSYLVLVHDPTLVLFVPSLMTLSVLHNLVDGEMP
jgi:hypothetical protein